MADRMRGRADEGKFFEEVAPGLFRRLKDGNEPAPHPAPEANVVKTPARRSLRELATTIVPARSSSR